MPPRSSSPPRLHRARRGSRPAAAWHERQQGNVDEQQSEGSADEPYELEEEVSERGAISAPSARRRSRSRQAEGLQAVGQLFEQQAGVEHPADLVRKLAP
mmetsp:Transcript_116608/g.375388  ORF Transcript_116608/g.375388 Transcript_116608/m.375388 type:complete len:100 (+) Transcript_116608:193-492(+)